VLAPHGAGNRFVVRRAFHREMISGCKVTKKNKMMQLLLKRVSVRGVQKEGNFMDISNNLFYLCLQIMGLYHAADFISNKHLGIVSVYCRAGIRPVCPAI
jgi:hypothetical protein